MVEYYTAAKMNGLLFLSTTMNLRNVLSEMYTRNILVFLQMKDSTKLCSV